LEGKGYPSVEGLLDYNMDNLTMDHIICHVWRVPCSLHVKRPPL